MHVDRTGICVKPNFFSHVHRKGCSLQRESRATDTELIRFVDNFFATNTTADAAWYGVLSANCNTVRSIRAPSSPDDRATCVYDTGEPENPAHAEIFQTTHIKEADELELRKDLLMSVFQNGLFTKREEYRGGAIWQGVSEPARVPPTKKPRVG
jgi:hypothetical protein